jgi:hypothetical protein
MDEFQKEVIQKLTRIEEKLSDYPQVKADTREALNTSRQNKEDIQEMKGNNKWLWRTTVGAIIVWILNIAYGLIIKIK